VRQALTLSSATPEKSSLVRRTLVIGCGFIGSRIVEELLEQGAPPVVLTRSKPVRAFASRLPDDSLLIGDAADREMVEAALEDVGQIIYTAGGLLPAASEREPERDAELTLRPLQNVIDALRGRQPARLIYLSSGGTVYGDPREVPVGEDEPTRPRGVYGELHVRCEEAISRATREDGLRAQVLRCSTVYGEGQLPDRGQGVINTFISHIERDEPIELFGDGTTVRDYLYVGDLARIVVALLSGGDGPTPLNVGSGEGTSLIEVLGLVEAEVGRSATVIRHEERGFDVHRIVLDISRLHDLLKVDHTPLAEGVHRTHEWLAATAAKAS
jgi:UDP-glucose 4-epimerase